MKSDFIGVVESLITQIKLDNGGEPTFVTKRLEHYLKTVTIVSLTKSIDDYRFDTNGKTVVPMNDEVHYIYKLEYTDNGVKGMFLFN